MSKGASGGGKGTSGGARDKRVAERIRADVTEMLLRGDIRNPDVTGAIVSDVQVSADLGVARIFLRLLETDPSVARQKRVVAGMASASGFIRRELAQTLNLRRVPELRFEWDEVADRANRVEELLAEVRGDVPAGRTDAPPKKRPRGDREGGEQ